MSFQLVSAPNKIDISDYKITIFIGGSIELGVVRDWQKELIQWLENHELSAHLVALNPRREKWDSSWPVDDPNHAELREQIGWELTSQDIADIPVYLFAADTLSPITLLELGIYADKKPIICVEDGYKRRANVLVTAEHFGWHCNVSWDEFLQNLDQRIREVVRLRTA